MSETSPKRLGFFARYLTIWVAACMVVGVLFGELLPGATDMLRGLIVEHLWES
jgi:ACR3 family arsenite transporter